MFWAQCAHTQLNPFYHPFYPDVTHMRKDTRYPLPLYRTASDRKLDRAWEQGYGVELAKLKHFRVKGHHLFMNASRPGNAFTCTREPVNRHRPHTAFVRLSSVGHVPDVLAPVFWLPWWMLVR